MFSVVFAGDSRLAGRLQGSRGLGSRAPAPATWRRLLSIALFATERAGYWYRLHLSNPVNKTCYGTSRQTVLSSYVLFLELEWVVDWRRLGDLGRRGVGQRGLQGGECRGVPGVPDWAVFSTVGELREPGMFSELVLVAVDWHVQLGPVVSSQSRQTVASTMAVHWSSLVHPVRVLLHVLSQVGLLCIRDVRFERYEGYWNVVNEISRISLELREITGWATS